MTTEGSVIEMFKQAFKYSLPGIILSFVVPSVLAYFLIPLPTTLVSHVMGTGIDGALSAGVSSIIAVIVYMKSQQKNGGTHNG